MNLIQSGLPTVSNITLIEANTEYGVTLGNHTKKFLLQNRETNDLKLAFNPGESGTNYFTLKGSAVWYEDQVFGPITVYLQSPNAGTVVEIVSYMAVD